MNILNTKLEVNVGFCTNLILVQNPMFTSSFLLSMVKINNNQITLCYLRLQSNTTFVPIFNLLTINLLPYSLVLRDSNTMKTSNMWLLNKEQAICLWHHGHSSTFKAQEVDKRLAWRLGKDNTRNTGMQEPRCDVICIGERLVTSK